MKSSSDAQVYYVKASELKHDMDISSNGNKYIIMNVDMSDVGSAFTLPGQYKIDGTAIQANFENQKESQILWNFYDYNTDKVYEGTITQGSKMTGIILAPKCTVNGAPGNLGGTVIADTYNHTTGEIHGVRPYVESQIKNAAVKNSEKETKKAVLIGKEGMEKLKNSRVAVFGIGGVGGALRKYFKSMTEKDMTYIYQIWDFRF